VASKAQTIAPNMQLAGPDQQDLTSELNVIRRMLNLGGARLLELGCGAAEKTRLIAKLGEAGELVAVEIDPIQHEKNLGVKDLPTVTFKSYGAEEILEPDNSFDVVLMFKSLHHVPLDRMDDALLEIARVLKPGGHAYISEPVFAGKFNEVMRLFHDEEIVRRHAFEAMSRSVEKCNLALKEEYFFRNRLKLESWDQYEHGILNVTHTDHCLSSDTLAEVKRRFLSHQDDQGFSFDIPNRVDLLQKPL
jgi:ubiquinone/menaquinone biosynthesis C-methylase UbiE